MEAILFIEIFKITGAAETCAFNEALLELDIINYSKKYTKTLTALICSITHSDGYYWL